MNLKVLFLLAMVLVTLCLGEDRVTDRRKFCKCCASCCVSGRNIDGDCPPHGNQQFCHFCNREKVKIKRDCRSNQTAYQHCMEYHIQCASVKNHVCTDQ
uniref:Tan_12Cys n=1 Tax=Terebra anilis TaxID=553697 RepID=TCC_TERAN|nr:RecName: Full=Tan_12Cys; Flags: Precursor [Terebra anilis]